MVDSSPTRTPPTAATGDDPECANCKPVTGCDHKTRSGHRRITQGSTVYIGGCRSTRHRCRRFTLALPVDTG